MSCPPYADIIVGPNERLCCGESDIFGYRQERACSEAGWQPSAQQDYIHELWQAIRKNTSKVTYKVSENQGTLTCHEGGSPYDYEIEGRRERRCATKPLEITDPLLKIYEIKGCEYPSSTCGPAPDGTFTKGRMISPPEEGEEEEEGVSPAPTQQFYETWWFWLLVVLGILGIGFFSWLIVRTQGEQRKALSD